MTTAHTPTPWFIGEWVVRRATQNMEYGGAASRGRSDRVLRHSQHVYRFGGLEVKHKFQRPPEEDELMGFGSNGEESLIITLESFYPTTAPGVSGVIVPPSPWARPFVGGLL